MIIGVLHIWTDSNGPVIGACKFRREFPHLKSPGWGQKATLKARADTRWNPKPKANQPGDKVFINEHKEGYQSTIDFIPYDVVISIYLVQTERESELLSFIRYFTDCIQFFKDTAFCIL